MFEPRLVVEKWSLRSGVAIRKVGSDAVEGAARMMSKTTGQVRHECNGLFLSLAGKHDLLCLPMW